MGIRGEVLRRHKLWRLQSKYRAWSKTPAGQANSVRLAAMQNMYAGRRCFVVGNGPSLLKCDLDKLANEVTIVSNAHFLIWDKLNHIPTFLTVEDRLVAEDRAVDLRPLLGITKIYPFGLRETLQDNGELALYINFLWDYKPFPRFSNDFKNIVYWGGTVSYLNLQLAAYLGCRQIILIGFDHSYKVPAEQVVNAVIASKEVDVNHIHPNYFGPGYRWHDPNVERMEIGYECAKRELERSGIEVVNASIGGHLEVFPRVHYDSLFQGN